jgi:hypothetical protein
MSESSLIFSCLFSYFSFISMFMDSMASIQYEDVHLVLSTDFASTFIDFTKHFSLLCFFLKKNKMK